MSITTEGRAFAIHAHNKAGHMYQGGHYSNHLMQVVEQANKFRYLLTIGEFGCVTAAAWCHDLLEDTELSYHDVKKVIGERAADIVYAVTDAKGKNRRERAAGTYPDLAKDPLAVFTKLCDRLSNTSASQEKNSRFADMYKKEYKYFKETLYTEGLYEEMWAELDKINKDKT